MKEKGKIGLFRNVAAAGLIRRILFLVLLGVALAVAVVASVNAYKWRGKPFPGFLLSRRLTVGGVGLYHWTGTQAGLISYDRILKADGFDLATKSDLEAALDKVKIGDSVLYTVERGERIFTVSIGTMRFPGRDLLILFGTYFLAGLACISTGAVVFLMKPDTQLSWASFMVSLAAGIYYLCTFDVGTTDAGLLKVYIFAAGLSPFAFMHLSLLFPTKASIIDRLPRLSYAPFAISAVYIGLMEWTYPGPLSVSLWKLGPLFSGLAILMFIVSVLRVFVQPSSEISRQRAKVVLLGAAIAFPIPAYFMILGSTLGGTAGKYPILNNFLVFPVLVFPASIAYAIAKHNLFDVDVYIKRTIGYAIMTVLVGVAYFFTQVGVRDIVLRPVLGSAAESVYPVVFAFLVVFLFHPLNRVVQDGVDRMFYRKTFDYKETVLSASEQLSSVLDMNEIVRKIIHTVRETMFIDTSGLILAGSKGQTLRGYFIGDMAEGKTESGEREESIPPDDPLVGLVAREGRMVTKYDIAEDPRYREERQTCGKRFEDLSANLAIPLLHQGEVRGILAVGQKKSGHFFTREDIDLLTTLASHGAVAIENAKMAEQMKKEETVRTNLARYLSPQIVEDIVKKDIQVNLGGDRKVVTVLFSDIRDFTTITESRPPDQLVAILNEYFTEMAKIIFDHQGSLDKYIGDAIVAVFGSLIQVEYPARNAVAAAVAMMKRLPEMNKNWEDRYGFSMKIGIGINTGEVFLGNIGSPERMEFTVIGDTVNVASRFSGLAKPGQILVTKETVDALDSDIGTIALPPVQVKGKAEMLAVHQIKY